MSLAFLVARRYDTFMDPQKTNTPQPKVIHDIDDSAFNVEQPALQVPTPSAGISPFAAPQAPVPLPAEAQQPAPPQPPQQTTPVQPQPPQRQQPFTPNTTAMWGSSVPQQNSADVEHSANNQRHFARFKSFISFAVFVGCILLAAFLINLFVFQSYFVQGSSMTPTLQNNDRMIVEKVSRTLAHIQGKAYIPERGQIVVLDSELANHEQQLIKRVIALPGETIIIKDGTVTIKNNEHPEGFNVDGALGLNLEPTYISEPYEATIPENEVFVMGDNRREGGSHDSRMFGPVRSEDLEGRLWARILPLDKAQMFSVLAKLRL